MFARVIALIIVIHVTGAQAAPTRLDVGIAVATDMLPIYVALDEGFFAAHGLDVNATKLAVPSVGPVSLMSGGLQIAMANAPILLQAVEGGLDLVAVSAASRHVREDDYVSLVVGTQSGIKAAGDFRGKRVGIPGLGASYDIVFRYWLKQHNVDYRAVTTVETGLPQMEDLLKSGQLDAAAITEPVRTKIVRDGVGSRFSDFVIEVNPRLLGAIWIAKRDWAEGHRDEVLAFRAALAEAIGFIRDRPEETKAIETRHFGFLTPARPALTLEIDAADLKDFGDIMHEEGLLNGEPDVTKLVFH